jgi:hypothetical protein
MNRRRLILILVLMFFCSACSKISKVTPGISPTGLQVTRSVSPTSTSLATLSPSTATPTPTTSLTPAPSVTITPESTQTLTPNVRSQCLELETELPVDIVIEGALVLYGKDEGILPDGKEEVYLYDLSTRQSALLSPTEDGILREYERVAVSPDGRWFAYNETIPDLVGEEKYVRLRIMATDGEQIPLSDQPEEWGQIIGWLDDERLALTLWDRYDGTVIVLNPFKLQSQVILPTFPDLSPNGSYSWYAVGTKPIVIYDPTLTLVAYYKGRADNPWGNYALWDVALQKLLWERPTIAYDNTKPVWSPDGSWVAIALGIADENDDPPSSNSILYLIARDGEETRITNGVSGSLSWSPDGRYLAFWDILRWSLALLELKNRQITVYCVEPSAGRDPIWSPDGRWIAMNADVPDAATGVVIIDTIGQRAYRIVNDLVVRGWMTSAP